MKLTEIINLRLHNQLLTNKPLIKPADIVKWFGAIQSQEFEPAKWAVGQRIKNCTDKVVELAFNKGEILRTHVMRPTWHFVSPDDIKWMLKLSAPGINASCVSLYRRLELTDKIFRTAGSSIEKLLQKKGASGRNEIRSFLKQKGINTSDIRMSCILMKAELDGLICSGPRQDKQFTYALLDEVVPGSENFNREESLSELTQRYFISHGPAQIKDFTWWSGLTGSDAKKGIEMNSSKLLCEKINDEIYYFSSSIHSSGIKSSHAYLLSPYDEYTVGYRDRSIILDPQFRGRTGNGIFKPVILIKGKICGTWKRTLSNERVFIEADIFEPSIDVEDDKKIFSALKKYAKFLNKKLMT